jgi:tRNA (guanine37-N1)-methyltransferase
MRATARVVPRSDGERVRRLLADAGALRDDLAIRLDGDRLLLPVRTGVPLPPGLGAEVEEEFEVLSAPGPSDYRDLLDWTPERRARLPRSFDVVGELVLVRVPPELKGDAPAIGEALLAFVPGARLVGADGGVHGTARRRTLVKLAGTGGWRTRHRENGLELEVDLERAYFSPRLAREHALVASDIRTGDHVHDLCCGVGPFAATIARDGRARSITAVDSNSDAIDLLTETLARIPGGAIVRPVVADIGAFVASAPAAECTVVNLPREGIKYLPSVARTVAPRGRLFYYEVTPRTEIGRRGETIVRSFDRPEEWTPSAPRVVHAYSPGSDLVAYRLERGPYSEGSP